MGVTGPRYGTRESVRWRNPWRLEWRVHRLLPSEPGLLHEVPDTSGTDLGPAYELAPRT
jgi:hypothetical protein